MENFNLGTFLHLFGQYDTSRAIPPSVLRLWELSPFTISSLYCRHLKAS